jgi:hypothetical protein
MDARTPQLQGQRLIFANVFSNESQRWDRNPWRLSMQKEAMDKMSDAFQE